MLQIQATTITQKGQVTIPAPVRKALGLKPGDQINFKVTGKTKAEIKPKKRFSIMSLYGSLKPKVIPNLSGQELIKWEEQAWPQAAVERDQKTMRSINK